MDWEHPVIHYVLRAAEMPWQWGVHDCFLFPANWVMQTCGRDPAQDHRGHYSDRRGAADIAARYGGLVALASRGMNRIGWRLCAPCAGCVGVVQVRDVGPVGSICLGGGLWASLMVDTGIAISRFKPLASWEE